MTKYLDSFIAGFLLLITAVPAVAVEALPPVPAYVGVDPVPWWGADPQVRTEGDQCTPVETQRIYDIDQAKLAEAA